MKYNDLTLPVGVIIEGPFSVESLRYCARMTMDPEYSKAYGRSKAEALGNLIFAFPGFFSPIFIDVKENK